MHFRYATYKNSFGRAITGNVAKIKIAELRCAFVNCFKFNCGRLSFFSCQHYRVFGHIIHVEQNGFGANIFHVYIVYKNIFNNTAAATGCFKPKANISTDKCTVADKHIICAATHFATHHKASMRMINNTIIYNYILCRHSSFSSFCITATFYGNAIIAGIKIAIFN